MTQNRARNNQSRTKKSEPSSTSFLATTARGFHYTKQNLRFSSSILLKFIFTQRYRNYALKYVWIFCNSKIKLNLVINIFCKFQKLPACLSLCLYLCQRCDNVLGFMMRVLGNRLWRIYHYYSTRTWILIKHPFYLLYFICIDVVNIPSFVSIVVNMTFNQTTLLSFIFFYVVDIPS